MEDDQAGVVRGRREFPYGSWAGRKEMRSEPEGGREGFSD